MEYYDLDRITAPKRFVKFQGEKYEIVPMTVRAFMQAVERAKVLRDEQSAEQNVQAMVDNITLMVPSMGQIAPDMSFPQLWALTLYLNGRIDESADGLADELKPVKEDAQGNG